jgi:hypothetical protein
MNRIEDDEENADDSRSVSFPLSHPMGKGERYRFIGSSFLATLGFESESLWDSPFQASMGFERESSWDFSLQQALVLTGNPVVGISAD